jgi:hypothetical protein
MYFTSNDDRPLTPSERWIAGIFLGVLLGLFAGALLVDFEPRKLAVLFFVVFWFPLLVLHEAGHALAAVWVGWRVERISIGMGPRVSRFRLGRILVDLRLYPMEGFVQPVPARLRHPRFESAFIYFAGPGIEMVVLAVLAAMVGPETLLSRSDSLWVITAQSLALAIVVGLVFNLVPHAVMTDRGPLANDGLGIIRSFLMPESHYAAQIGVSYDADTDEWVENDQADWWKR